MAATDMIRFNERLIKRAQARIGVLRGELAARAHVSPGVVRAALRGDPIGLKSARSIARAIGIELAALLADEPAAATTREAVR